MACAAALWLREAPRYRARVVRQVWPPQGEHCQSCSSAVQPRRFCGLKRFGALRAITQTREKAKCCRVADARSTNAYKGGLKLASSRIREFPGTKKGRGRAREVPSRLLPFLAPAFGRRHLQIARGLKPARRLQARCTGGEDWSATVPISTRVQRNAAFSRN